MAEKRPDRTLGPGHDEFWASCARGELRLQRCGHCGKLLWPVTAACGACGGTELSWQQVSGRGTLVSWCSFVQDYYRGLLPLPYDTILVELAEGPLFIANPDGFSEAECVPGLAVELRFRTCEDTAGSFALPVFANAEPAEAWHRLEQQVT
jgi:uncharacterized OB-fold protein